MAKFRSIKRYYSKCSMPIEFGSEIPIIETGVKENDSSDEDLIKFDDWENNVEATNVRSDAEKSINVRDERENNGKLEESCKQITDKDDNINSSIKESTKLKDERENNGKLEESCKQITDKDDNINSSIKESTKLKGLVGLSENFEEVFLSEEDSDVVIKVGDKSYPAHKVIIKARSSVFKAMLNHDMKEKNEGIIDIPDCDSGIFRDFLFYIYTGKIDDISKDNVFELHRISDQYDVRDLKTECVDFILKNMSVDIICDIIALATSHSEEALLARAIEFFTDHAQDILPSLKWQIFVKNYPVEANELFLKTFNKLSRK